MRKLVTSAMLASMSLLCFGQDAPKEEKQKIQFSGFVKNDMFYDTREMVAAREGHFHLYPANENLDADGNDINANSNLNILAIQTRLRAKMSGPEAFGGKSSGFVEGAFFGHSNGDVNGFRLRHAFGKINWTNTELLFGQTWHPMFITGCFPGTISFSTGVPFQPFSRNPQLRVTHSIGGIKVMLAALSQRDFTSSNPVAGTPGSTPLQQSATPDMQFQTHYGTKNDSAGTAFLAGFGAGYKTLKPQVATGAGYATDETISSYSTMAFLKLKLAPVTIKLEGVYGQNMTDLLMLGGYAVSDSAYDSSTDEVDKEIVSYTNINTMSAWLDIHTNGKKVQAGLFAGYTANLGADADVIGKTYARGANISHVYRVAPRVMFNSGKVRFAIEPDYTVAAYATKQDAKLVTEESNDVSNIRLLFSAYYFF